jgi:hypothetical protein
MFSSQAVRWQTQASSYQLYTGRAQAVAGVRLLMIVDQLTQEYERIRWTVPSALSGLRPEQFHERNAISDRNTKPCQVS